MTGKIIKNKRNGGGIVLADLKLCYKAISINSIKLATGCSLKTNRKGLLLKKPRELTEHE